MSLHGSCDSRRAGRPDRHPDPARPPASRAARRRARRRSLALGDELSDLQERLFAEGASGGHRAGAAGAPGHGHLRQGRRPAAHGRAGRPAGRAHHLVQGADRGGARATTSCGGSSRRCPRPGIIGVFDRSHYEDVLIARVRELAPPQEIERRYDAINDFEKRLVDEGTVVVKCMLHISRRRAEGSGCWPGSTTRQALEVQPRRRRRARALGRLPRRPTRSRWSAPTPSTRRGTSSPATSKWYRNLAVGAAAPRDAARHATRSWPEPDYDVEEQRSRLTGEDAAS